MIDHDHNNRIKVLQNGTHPPPPAGGTDGEQTAKDRPDAAPAPAVALLFWLWNTGRKAAFLGIAFVAALIIVSEGFRVTYPVMGMPLWKMPGLGFLRGFQGWHRLDAAYLISALLIPTVCSLYVALIRLRMVNSYPQEIAARGWNPAVYQYLVTGLGAVLLPVDAIVFYLGASNQASGSWGDGAPVLAALFLTVAYIGFVVYGSFLAVTTSRK